MIDLYVTFGMKYAREPHPTYPKAHPDGWLRITAPTVEDAFNLIARRIGTAYAFYYTSANFEPHWHPMGELDHWTVGEAEVAS